jgi:hypothetical protein
LFVCCECCVFVRYRSLRRADHLSRGVLPTVVCPYVWSRDLKNEDAKTRKWVVKASKRTWPLQSSASKHLYLCRLSPILALHHPEPIHIPRPSVHTLWRHFDKKVYHMKWTVDYENRQLLHNSYRWRHKNRRIQILISN